MLGLWQFQGLSMQSMDPRFAQDNPWIVADPRFVHNIYIVHVHACIYVHVCAMTVCLYTCTCTCILSSPFSMQTFTKLFWALQRVKLIEDQECSFYWKRYSFGVCLRIQRCKRSVKLDSLHLLVVCCESIWIQNQTTSLGSLVLTEPVWWLYGAVTTLLSKLPQSKRDKECLWQGPPSVIPLSFLHGKPALLC